MIRNTLILFAVGIGSASHSTTLLDTENCVPTATTIESDAPSCDTDAMASKRLEMERAQDNIFFSTGIELADNSKAQLTTLKNVLNTETFSNTCFMVVGHSDASGSNTVNQAMGLKRAQTVAAMLSSEPNPVSNVIKVESKGETELLVGFDPNHRRHRRVTILAKTCD